MIARVASTKWLVALTGLLEFRAAPKALRQRPQPRHQRRAVGNSDSRGQGMNCPKDKKGHERIGVAHRPLLRPSWHATVACRRAATC